MARRTDPLQALLTGYDGTFLDCRNLGHVWATQGFYRGAHSEVLRQLVCQRCDTNRTDRWTTGGDRIAARYAYGEGYRIEGFRLAPNLVRQEIIKRAVVYASQDEMLSSLMDGDR